jgi:acyl-CoA hydrolase
VKIDAYILYTGNLSIHIATDIYSRKLDDTVFTKKTHCVVVFVSVDGEGNPIPVRKWVSTTDRERKLEAYAIKLKRLRLDIENEMKPFFNENN